MIRSRWCRRLVAAGLAFAIGGCDSGWGVGLDLTDFVSIPRVEALDFGSIEPAESWDYWELRRTFAPASEGIIGSGGTISRSELTDEVRAQLDMLDPDFGFGPGCPPGGCFEFVATVSGSTVTTFTTESELRSFLGRREALAEAVLLLHAAGYHWYGDEVGIRRRESGWDAVVLELVELCAPIRTDRVLLRVPDTGPTEEWGREVWSRTENACI